MVRSGTASHEACAIDRLRISQVFVGDKKYAWYGNSVPDDDICSAANHPLFPIPILQRDLHQGPPLLLLQAHRPSAIRDQEKGSTHHPV